MVARAHNIHSQRGVEVFVTGSPHFRLEYEKEINLFLAGVLCFVAVKLNFNMSARSACARSGTGSQTRLPFVWRPFRSRLRTSL